MMPSHAKKRGTQVNKKQVENITLNKKQDTYDSMPLICGTTLFCSIYTTTSWLVLTSHPYRISDWNSNTPPQSDIHTAPQFMISIPNIQQKRSCFTHTSDLLSKTRPI